MKIPVAMVIIIGIIAQILKYLNYSSDIEIDVFSGYGGAYYPPAIARPEVVVVNQQPMNYMPLPGGQMMMPQPQPQPYGQMAMTNTTGYYQQQQGYQYQQYQHMNNPPYPRY